MASNVTSDLESHEADAGESVDVGQDPDTQTDNHELKVAIAKSNREVNSRTFLCRLPINILVAVIIEATILTEDLHQIDPDDRKYYDWPNVRLSGHLSNIQLDHRNLDILANVCHHLRQIVLGTGQLWSDVREYPPGYLDTRGLRDLSRSQTAPLQVLLSNSPFDPIRAPEDRCGRSVVLTEYRRIEDLAMIYLWEDDIFVLDSLRNAPFNRLKSLQIFLECHNEVACRTVSNLFQGDAPSLRRLELRSAVISWTSPIFNHLNTLFLGRIPKPAGLPFPEFMAVITRSSSTLEDLILESPVFLSTRDSENSNRLHSPKRYAWVLPRLLRFKTLGEEAVCKTFVQGVGMPSVKRISVTAWLDYRGNDYGPPENMILPDDLRLIDKCAKLELKVDHDGSSLETRWWKHENDVDVHQEVIYNDNDREARWKRLLHLLQLSDTSSVSTLDFHGDTRTIVKTQVHPMLAQFHHLKKITFSMTSNQEVFCNPVINGLLLLHEDDSATETLVLPHLRELVFRKSKVNCISRAAHARYWTARLEKMDEETRKKWTWLTYGSQADSCVLSNLKKTLEIRHAKGAPGVSVRFESCQRIIERNVKDFLEEPFISSLVFKDCIYDYQTTKKTENEG